MPRQPTFPVVVISHPDSDEEIVCWGYERGLKTVESCLYRRERIEVRRTRMTEKSFDALEEYEGEC